MKYFLVSFSLFCLFKKGRHHSFMEIDHEIFSKAFSPFCRFKKGSCQFLTKEYAQILVNRLED